MKVLLLLVMFVFGDTLTGFWGIPFGSSTETVKKLMIAKGGKFSQKNSTKTFLMFTDVRFAGRTPVAITFGMVNNKMHTARVYYTAEVPNLTLDLYQDIKGELNTRYFVSTADYANFKSPYSEGDGYEISAIKLGAASYSCYWFFTRPGEQDPEVTNVLWLEIDTDLYVILGYQDGRLIKTVRKDVEDDY